MIKLIPTLLILLSLAMPLRAQDLSALARFDVAASKLRADAGGVDIALAISQPVPWRLRLMADPPRLIVDVREVDWTGIDRLTPVLPVVAIRAGVFRPGWSRLVLELDGPQRVTGAEMATGGRAGAVIRLTLAPTDAQTFATAAALPDLPEWAVPDAATLAAPVKSGSGRIVVVLDPGHGGIDPGAEREGMTEAALMLTFARELKDLLTRDGRFSVVMTRDEDVFVPLEMRISIARDAGASLFLSLHADALAEGEATGATVYTLSDDASDEAAATLAERHDRDDLLAGIDLTDQDDLVAEVLMDMARTQTAPRSDRLADAVVAAIKAAEIRMHQHPRQSGGFSVLKSPDIPSVLLELGFLSSARDLKRLGDPQWRATLAGAIVQAIGVWARDDAALRALDQP
jgi:N-acetylmuramoyl-L-alanine amidase